MDCTTCSDLLMDLLYQELDQVRSAAVRKHLEGCASCREAFARLQGARFLVRQPAEEPVPEPSSVVLEALRAAAEAARSSPEEKPASAEPTAKSSSGSTGKVLAFPPPPSEGSAPKESRLGRLLASAGAFAMRREVAMAAVFLVMLGVGLVFYQSHPRPTDAQDDRTGEVVPAVEVTPERPNAAAESRRAVPLTPTAAPALAGARRPMVASPAPTRAETAREDSQLALPSSPATNFAQAHRGRSVGQGSAGDDLAQGSDMLRSASAGGASAGQRLPQNFRGSQAPPTVLAEAPARADNNADAGANAARSQQVAQGQTPIPTQNAAQAQAPAAAAPGSYGGYNPMGNSVAGVLSNAVAPAELENSNSNSDNAPQQGNSVYRQQMMPARRAAPAPASVQSRPRRSGSSEPMRALDMNSL